MEDAAVKEEAEASDTGGAKAASTQAVEAASTEGVVEAASPEGGVGQVVEDGLTRALSRLLLPLGLQWVTTKGSSAQARGCAGGCGDR